MLKRIPVEHLRPGMHVARFDGAWLDHPFWRQSRRQRLNDRGARPRHGSDRT